MWCMACCVLLNVDFDRGCLYAACIGRWPVWWMQAHRIYMYIIYTYISLYHSVVESCIVIFPLIFCCWIVSMCSPLASLPLQSNRDCVSFAWCLLLWPFQRLHLFECWICLRILNYHNMAHQIGNRLWESKCECW